MEICVLGAGYMGSALAVIAAARGHRVRLWGTWLDDALVAACSRGEAHPRLRMPLPSGIEVLPGAELDRALRDVEAVVCAVNSDGVLPVLDRALAHLPAEGPWLSVTKGFIPDDSGAMQRISTVVTARLRAAGRSRPFVHIGGPCKAMEVARGVATSVVWASEDAALLARWADALESPSYTISRSDDLAGAETCSAFKNAYATASGLCDGLQKHGHPEMHNTKALLFTQAVQEIVRMVAAMGGRRETALGLCGMGDLHVTAAAGRNRAYGERVGQGEAPDKVAAEMAATGELTEGYPALRTGWQLLQQRIASHELRLLDFPLLQALHRIVYCSAPVATTLLGLRVRT